MANVAGESGSIKQFAVIMAGGSGERFWPLSRQNHPKQLLRLTNPQQTLLEEAVVRIAPLVGRENVRIATSTTILEPVRASGLLPPECVFAEPCRRNTLGALVWAVATLAASLPDGEDFSMAVLTADHMILQPPLFRQTVASALDVAERHGALVTIGVAPTRPETGYGYIELDAATSMGGGFRVASFREKPALDVAREYIDTGRFLWNSGMFFWLGSSFRRELSEAAPEAAGVLDQIVAALRAGDRARAEAAFETLPSVSIDYALMEKATRVAVVPGRFAWDDVGAWDALERTMPRDDDGNVAIGAVAEVGAHGCVFYNDAPGVTIAAVGVQDLVVVVSKDAVLVVPKDQAQRVKEIMTQLPDSVK